MRNQRTKDAITNSKSHNQIQAARLAQIDDCVQNKNVWELQNTASYILPVLSNVAVISTDLRDLYLETGNCILMGVCFVAKPIYSLCGILARTCQIYSDAKRM